MWVEEEEWAYPIVYRPVSVDDEEVCEASSWKKEKKRSGERRKRSSLNSKLRIYVFAKHMVISYDCLLASSYRQRFIVDSNQRRWFKHCNTAVVL